MKNTLPITLFLILYLINDTVAKTLGIPKYISWTLEAFIGVIAVIVIARIIASRRFDLPIKYILLFSGFLYVIIAGIVTNEVTPLTSIAGIRTYFKYLPIFLLPFAYNYSIEDLKTQFSAILALGLIQVPISLYQRFIESRFISTGDYVSGTLNNSNSLSIVMISMIVMLFSLYFKKIISLKFFAFLSILLFIPATINETKITPILLGFGFAAIIFAIRKDLTLKQFTTAVISGLLLLIMFVSLYNILYTDDSGSTFADKLSKKELIDNYAYKGYLADPRTILNKKSDIVGADRDLPDFHMGRVDSVLIPLNVLFNGGDITTLMFGLGIGNVNSSQSDAEFNYINSLGGGNITIALLLWETGIIGTLIFIFIMILMSRDAYILTKNQDSWGGFAVGWFGISVIMISTLLYNNFLHMNELACLFMYFSGICIVRRQMLRKQ